MTVVVVEQEPVFPFPSVERALTVVEPTVVRMVVDIAIHRA